MSKCELEKKELLELARRKRLKKGATLISRSGCKFKVSHLGGFKFLGKVKM